MNEKHLREEESSCRRFFVFEKKNSGDKQRCFSVGRLSCRLVLAITEQQRDAPDARRADQRVNDAADERALTAEKIRDQIELEKTDQAPVDCADDDQQK